MGVRMGRNGWQAAESRSCSTQNFTWWDSASFTEPAQPDRTPFPTFSFASVALPGFAPHSGNPDWQDGCCLSTRESLLLLLYIFSLQPNLWWSTLGRDCHCSFRSLGKPLKPSGLQSPYP